MPADTLLWLFTVSRRVLSAPAPLWSAEPEVGAAWGAFGAIFTAIAVAHTLYAPREVILWNWRRIVLLGLSLALAVGSQFSLVIVVPVALAVHALSCSHPAPGGVGDLGASPAELRLLL